MKINKSLTEKRNQREEHGKWNVPRKLIILSYLIIISYISYKKLYNVNFPNPIHKYPFKTEILSQN